MGNLAGKVAGFIMGWAVGDALGAPLTGIKAPWFIDQKYKTYPILDYVVPVNSYRFLAKGQYTYCTQVMRMMVKSMIGAMADKNSDKPWSNLLFNKFSHILATNYLRGKYRGIDVMYQLLCTKMLGTVFGEPVEAFLYTGYDKESCLPLMYIAPLGLFSGDYISFWTLQGKHFQYLASTRKCQLLLIMLVRNAMVKQKLNWETVRDNIEESTIPCTSSKVLIAAAECMRSTDNYKDAVVRAINDFSQYGNEIGSIVGGLAGVRYGYDDIPEYWIDGLEDNTSFIKLINNFNRTFYG